MSENGDFALMPKGGKRYISWWVEVFKGRSDLSAKTAHARFVILCMCLSVDVVMHTTRCCAHFLLHGSMQRNEGCAGQHAEVIKHRTDMTYTCTQARPAS